MNFKSWFEQQMMNMADEKPMTQVKQAALRAVSANQDASQAIKNSISAELQKKDIKPRNIAKLAKVADEMKADANPLNKLQPGMG